MDDPHPTRLSDLPVAEAALLDLSRPFAPAGFSPQCAVVQPDQIPHPQDQLLVHHEHMTIVLEKHHGAPVDVGVIEEHLDGDIYTRKIRLVPRDTETVVEWGVVKLDFAFMAPEVRDEILARKLPLGAVLIKHDVLRRIKPRWFLRLPRGGPALGLFASPDAPDPAFGADAYGRIGTIYCDEQPAIELIEIVVNCGRIKSGT